VAGTLCLQLRANYGNVRLTAELLQMAYGIDNCLRDLIKVWHSTVTDEEEMSLVFFLLAIMRDQGSKGVVNLIHSFGQSKLGDIEITETDSGVVIRITREGLEPLVVKAGDDDLSPWVDVRTEPDAESMVVEDSRHAAFYSTWERLLNRGADSAKLRSTEENAVYLIALLESEVMNGGLGQYLTNTEGHYLSETFSCLEQIGATRTHALLTAAVELASRFDTYVHAWDEMSESYSRLDAEFLESSEDLATLTAEAFLR